MTAKKTSKIKGIIGATFIISLYMIFDGLKTFSMVSFLSGVVAFLSALSLVFDSKASRYLYIFLSVIVSIDCVYGMILKLSLGQLKDNQEALWAFLPIAILLAAFWWMSVSVFKHFSDNHKVIK